MGVFLVACLRRAADIGLPHVRGGVSFPPGLAGAGARSSPRAWGCFRIIEYITTAFAVFPTCVGVFLIAWQALSLLGRLPHVRGGVSQFGKVAGLAVESSPRAWGCFQKSFSERALR